MKSDVLGGTNPGPLATRWPVICTSRTHLSPTLAFFEATGFGYKFLRTNFRRRNPIGKAGKSKTLMGELYVLLATKSEPDQVDRGAGSQKESAEEEVVVGMEPVVEAKADSTPDEEA